MAREKKTDTLYMTSSPRNTIAVVDASTNTSLWHRRLGHMSEKRDEDAAVKRKITKIEVH